MDHNGFNNSKTIFCKQNIVSRGRIRRDSEPSKLLSQIQGLPLSVMCSQSVRKESTGSPASLQSSPSEAEATLAFALLLLDDPAGQASEGPNLKGTATTPPPQPKPTLTQH